MAYYIYEIKALNIFDEERVKFLEDNGYKPIRRDELKAFTTKTAIYVKR